jgi:hypothetical protein
MARDAFLFKDCYNQIMNKAYLWLIGPILAGLLAWGLSGNWQLGIWLLLATGAGNYIAYRASNKR